MEQLNYTLTNEDGTPFLREYVYHVGSFHYNWHKEIETCEYRLVVPA